MKADAEIGAEIRKVVEAIPGPVRFEFSRLGVPRAGEWPYSTNGAHPEEQSSDWYDSIVLIVRRAPAEPQNCPWCGSTAMIHKFPEDRASVICNRMECKAYGPYAPSEASAIAAWNRITLKADQT